VFCNKERHSFVHSFVQHLLNKTHAIRNVQFVNIVKQLNIHNIEQFLCLVIIITILTDQKYDKSRIGAFSASAVCIGFVFLAFFLSFFPQIVQPIARARDTNASCTVSVLDGQP